MKAGYKQTEAGVIPEDWDVVALGDIASVSAGGTPSRSNTDFWGGEIPWITTAEVNFGVIGEAQQFITQQGLQNSATKLVPVGTLLLALYGQGKTRGKVGILGFEAATNQACAAIILENGSSHEYIFHFLVNQYEEIRKLSNTGNQENLNGGLVRSIPILRPPLAEQSAIATALGDVDALLAAQDALIAKKRAIKQGAMQELLTGKRRLPGFSGEWRVKRLGDFGACHRGVSYNPSTDLLRGDTQKSVRLLRANNVQDSSIDLAGIQFVRNERVADHQYLRSDDVLICMANGSKDLVGKAAQFALFDGMKYTFGAFMGCYRPDPTKVSPIFSFYLFQTEAYRLHLANLLAGSSINNLSPKSIEGMEIAIPVQDEEQTAIAAALSDMDTELTALEAQRAKTAQLKQGMMQALLTGRIRLV